MDLKILGMNNYEQVFKMLELENVDISTLGTSTTIITVYFVINDYNFTRRYSYEEI